MQDNGIREFARRASCRLRKVSNRMPPKARGGGGSACGRQFLAKSKNIRICKKSFLAKAGNWRFARRNLEIRGEASCKTMESENLQETLLAACEKFRMECPQRSGAAVRRRGAGSSAGRRLGLRSAISCKIEEYEDL